MQLHFRRFSAFAALLCTALVLWGCSPSPQEESGLSEFGLRRYTVDEVLDAQLGELVPHVSPLERLRARNLLSMLMPLREKRLVRDEAEPGLAERMLTHQLNTLYEECTVKYLDGYTGDDGWGWSHEELESTVLATFSVNAKTGELSGTLQNGMRRKGEVSSPELDEYGYIWDDVRTILPAEALSLFTAFTVWSDGPEETLAYVQPADDEGAAWEIAIDPADLDDGMLFVETVLHEYFHAYTLNDGQVQYGPKHGALTYTEPWMTTQLQSYLNQFYRRFWGLILDDRLAASDSYNFYLRHETEFIDAYASTDPSEDIAESFAAFVLLDKPEAPESVAAEKLLFFYEYEELVALREAIRTNLTVSALLNGEWENSNGSKGAAEHEDPSANQNEAWKDAGEKAASALQIPLF